MTTKYTKEILQEAVEHSDSLAAVLRHLGLKQAGGTQYHISNKIKEYEIDVKHFKGQAWSRGKSFPNKRLTAHEILIILPDGSKRTKRNLLVRAMTEKKIEYCCSMCGNNGEWQGSPMTLDVDHIDGNWYNNKIDNLRFLCPNCHSQQDTNKSWKYSKPA